MNQEAWKQRLIISNGSIKIKYDPLCVIYRKFHMPKSYTNSSYPVVKRRLKMLA
uniref:Uncharacterized protein n=1 Tax=Oryctolagus cuniculus TaxID=9986 RepID=A0A5F9CQZ4_RABIT